MLSIRFRVMYCMGVFVESAVELYTMFWLKDENNDENNSFEMRTQNVPAMTSILRHSYSLSMIKHEYL